MIEELLALATEVATAAGVLVLERRGAGRHAVERGVVQKSSRTDLATAADLASEQLIRELISIARPEDRVLGEETGLGADGDSGGDSGGSGLVWIVDPIDGTTNFVYDFPSFAISVAVAEEHPATPADGALAALLGRRRVLAGVVHDPVRGETFAAASGRGATLDGVPLRVEAEDLPLGESLVGTGFSYLASERRVQAELLVGVLPAVRDIRRAGAASLDLCAVAAGRLDGYYEAGLKAWDLAAGALVASEAGAACLVLEDLPPGGPTLVACRPGLAASLPAALSRAARPLAAGPARAARHSTAAGAEPR